MMRKETKKDSSKETFYTKEEVIDLLREEIKESFEDSMNEARYKNKLYTILGIAESALDRKKNA